MKKIGVYSGSFDPLHNGHLWVIEEAAKLFDELHVVVGSHPKKQALLTKNERYKLLKNHLSGENIKIETLGDTNNIVDYVDVCCSKDGEKPVLVRGIRNPKDTTYEAGIVYNIRQYAKTSFNPDLQSIFFLPPPELTSISSTKIKDAINEGHWTYVKENAPNWVYDALKDVYNSWIVLQPEIASVLETSTAGLAPRGINLLSSSGHNFVKDVKPNKMRDNFNKLVSLGFIKFPEQVMAVQVRAMLDPFPYDVAVSPLYFLKRIRINAVKALGERYVLESQSLGPIIVDYNEVLGDDTELGELGPLIIIEGKHRWLDAKEAGEETILAYVGEKAWLKYKDLLEVKNKW